MAVTTSTLKHFQDFELAFINAYKNEESNFATEDVEAEIEARHLNSDKLNTLIQAKLDIEVLDHDCKVCPRCTSERIKTITEEFHGNNKAFGLDSGKPLTFIDYKVCEVCGWNFSVDETSAEKKERITKTLVSVLASVIVTLLLTYIFIRFSGIVD